MLQTTSVTHELPIIITTGSLDAISTEGRGRGQEHRTTGRFMLYNCLGALLGMKNSYH